MNIEKEKILREAERIKREEEKAVEGKKEIIPSREVSKGEKEEEIKKQLSNLKKSISSTHLSTRDEKKEIKNLSYPEKVGALISLTFEKGIEEATSIAVSLGDPSLVDEFHDTLIDQHKEKLIEEGIINGKKGTKKYGKSNFLKIFLFLFLLIVLISMLIFLFI